MSNTNILLKIPTQIYHFHNKSKKRIVATIAVAQTLDGGGDFLVGITRASKKEKRPSRAEGRARAEERLLRGLGVYDNPVTDPALAMGEKAQNLLVKMTKAEFENTFSASNPFIKFGCRFGATDEEIAQIEKQKKAAKKLAKRRQALRQTLHEKALKEAAKIREAKKQALIESE